MRTPQQAHARGPKPKPFLGHVADFGRDPLGFLTRSVDAYGTIVRLRLEANRDTYLVSDLALPLLALKREEPSRFESALKKPPCSPKQS